MKTRWIVLGVIGAILLLAIGVVASAVGTYNDLVKEDTAVEAQSKQVDVQYQLAFRLVPQLTQLAEQYLANETEVMTQVAALRSGLTAAQGEGTSFEEKDDYNQQMNGFIALLGNRLEAYPTLQGAALIRDVMDQVIFTESKIAAEKVRYNDKVEAYNGHIRECCLPAMVAGLFGFDKAEYIGYKDRPDQSSFEGEL